MYPHPPRYHRPTNYYWIIVVCVALMLLGLFIGLRRMAGRFNPATAQTAELVTRAPATPKAPAAASAAARPTVAPAASAAATPTAQAAVEVSPKELTDQPATYRSRLITVSGTVFYTGKLQDGKTWIQIVGPNNVYVNGSSSDALPAGVAKGVKVQITGLGAGLTNITAANGKNYDEAFVDPVQKVEVLP